MINRIKPRRRRARIREILYHLAINMAYLAVGTAPVWLPIMMIVVAGGVITLVGL